MPTLVVRGKEDNPKFYMKWKYKGQQGNMPLDIATAGRTTKAIRKDAERAMARAWVEKQQEFERVAASEKMSAGKPLVVQVMDEYIEDVRNEHMDEKGRELTFMAYVRAMRNTFSEHWPNLLTAEFGPKAATDFLTYVTKHGGNGKKGASTETVNRYQWHLRKFVEWALRRELLADYAGRIMLFERIKDGTAGTKKAVMRIMAPGWAVDRVVKNALKVIRDLLELHDIQGCRSAEILELKACEIDREHYRAPDGSPIWVADISHRAKCKNKGKKRYLIFGPKAQAVLKPRIVARRPDEYLFDPHEAIEQIAVKRHRPVRKDGQPSGRTWQKNKPAKTNRLVRNHYDHNSYCKAVKRICKKIRDTEDKDFPIFTPHQLRHKFITENAEDKEAARQAAGHAKEATTEGYVDPEKLAEMDIEKAVILMWKVG